jgi:hypothetical protein
MADSVTDVLAATLRATLSWTRTDSQEVGSVVSRKTILSSYTIADGSGAGQADLVFADQRTIPPETIEAFDLLDLEQTALGVAVPFVFRQLRLIKVVNNETAAGQTLLVGVDPGRPTAVYAAAVGPGSEWFAINNTDSWVVTADNSIVRIANTTEDPISYSLYLLGTSTAPPEEEEE